MQNKSLECCICLEIFKEPVECSSCHNNICKVHTLKLKQCPLCKSSPFNYKDNVWLKRELKDITFCKCSICSFEGDNNQFLLHLMEKHKTELIKNFNLLANEQKKEDNHNKSSNSIQKTISFDYGVYTGEVKDGIPEGRGKLIYGGKYQGDSYEGDFRKGEPNGKGIYCHSNGNIYEGSFRNDKAYGKGIFYYKNGDRYEGDFIDDNREGKGIYYFANNDRMMGDYHNNMPIGNHAILHFNGSVSLKKFN